MPAFYCKSIQEFLSEDSDAIVGQLLSGESRSGFYQHMNTQTPSWQNFISLLKSQLPSLSDLGLDFRRSGVLLEYPIPRREKRIDCVLILNDLVIIVEFKDN